VVAQFDGRQMSTERGALLLRMVDRKIGLLKHVMVCVLMEIAVLSLLYRTTRSDEALRGRLVELARKKRRFGYRRLHIR
jgi:hypothetical protein